MLRVRRGRATVGRFGVGRGAFYTLVPIRPRWRGERRFLRTLPGVSLRPRHGFNPRPRRLSTPPDAFQLHPDFRLYRTALTMGSRGGGGARERYAEVGDGDDGGEGGARGDG